MSRTSSDGMVVKRDMHDADLRTINTIAPTASSSEQQRAVEQQLGGREVEPGGRAVYGGRVEQPLLELVSTPCWFYDSETGCNVCGNRAALQLFGVDATTFSSRQSAIFESYSSEQRSAWCKLNTRIHEEVEVGGKEIGITVTQDKPSPGFLPFSKGLESRVLTAVYKPYTLRGAEDRPLALVQVLRQHTTAAGTCDATQCDEESCQRLVEMCNNHPMFQFLFDENGKLLAGNKRAMQNLIEHLGEDQRDYMLLKYLSLGEFSVVGEDQAKNATELYQEAMKAIFIDEKPCHRFPQLRESKRHPGKYRWVLYEMWPQTDPITHRPAVLICEQNITQVKALEDQFKKQNIRLQAQLEEALQQRDQGHKPAIDIDTPADKTLKLLDKIMRGQEVDPREAMLLRDSIIKFGDLRQPVNFNEQVMGQSLDLEVGESLIQLLSSRKSSNKQGEGRASTMDGSVCTSGLTTSWSGGPGRSSGPLSSAQVQLQAQRAAAAGHGQEPGSSLSLGRYITEEATVILSKVDEWQFDAFQLHTASNGRPLSMLSYHLFKRFELIEKFQLDEDKLVRFLRRVEEGYPSNPYHNRIHAADVLQSLHVLLYRGNLLQSGLVDDTALLACFLSAIIHDYEHRGVNNDFLVRVSDPLAILYNDRSPMENHHLAASFQLMHSEEFNFMPMLSGKVKESLRKLVIEMVLATDMKQHFAIHSMFQAKMQLGSLPSSNSGPRSGSGSNQHKMELPHRVLDEDVKTLSIQLALKCADLGHLSSPRTVHKKWVQYLEEEFFWQGDREKKNHLCVSPLMDREKNGITKSQVGFFDIVALPLFQSFAQVFAETTPMLDAVKDNYAMWREDSALAMSSLTLTHSNNRARHHEEGPAVLGSSPPALAPNNCSGPMH